MAQRLSFT